MSGQKTSGGLPFGAGGAAIFTLPSSIIHFSPGGAFWCAHWVAIQIGFQLATYPIEQTLQSVVIAYPISGGFWYPDSVTLSYVLSRVFSGCHGDVWRAFSGDVTLLWNEKRRRDFGHSASCYVSRKGFAIVFRSCRRPSPVTSAPRPFGRQHGCCPRLRSCSPSLYR